MGPPRNGKRDVSPSPVEKKRARVINHSTSCSAEEEHTPSDVEITQSTIPDESTIRHGQAERKRELERNRRNLVNVRFSELEQELKCGIPNLHSASLEKGKRIDKEAVLKEAAQRLALQRKELASMCERISSLTTEVDNLRAEKSELRDDKSYLRSELETVRGDVKRLRSDNINLWQALKKATAFKDSFSPDVAKLPMELFLRSNQELNQQVSASAPQTITGSAPVPSNTFPTTQYSIPNLDVNQLRMQQQSVANQQPTSSDQQAILLSQMENQAAQEARRQQNVSMPSNRANPFAVNESLLVLQTPEELGELFTNYVPVGHLRQSQLSNGSPNLNQRDRALQSPVQLGSERDSLSIGSPNLASFDMDSNRIFQANTIKSKRVGKPPESDFNGDPSSLRNNVATSTEKSTDDYDIAPCV